MSKDLSPPAFPVSDSMFFRHGMSLRDYFAGQAMVAGTGDYFSNNESTWQQQMAKDCYLLADAMLEARKND